MKKIIFLIALVVSTSAIFGQDEELEVKGNVLYKDQVNSMKPPAPILNVPQSVSIITDEDILNQGFRALGDIVRYVPGIHSTQGEGHRDAMVIRGIRTTSDFYLDGQRDDVQYYRSLYNVEQVEVLKGPNALLFGRGGEGGLINRVTKKAKLGETFTNLNLGYDTFTANDFAIDTNMQLNDTVALRLMVHSDTLANHRDLYDGTRNGVNPTFTFSLNEATELNISLEYLDHERFIDRGIPTTGALVNEALNEVVYGDPNKNLHTTEGTILKANLEHNYSDNGKINLSIMGNNFNKMYQNIYIKDVTNGNSGCETSATITTVACMEGYRDTTFRESSILNLTNVNTFNRATLTVGLDLIDTDNDNERYHSHFSNEAADTAGAGGATLGASGIRNNFNLKINLNEVYIDEIYFVKNLQGLIFIKDNEVVDTNLSANFENNKNIVFSIETKNNGEKITKLYSSKAKPLVKRYKFIKGFDEGDLDFISTKKNEKSVSNLKIYDFKLKEVPALTKLLTLASLQGIADILTGEGIRFDEFEMKFNNQKNLMTIDELYAIGPAISILMSGYVEEEKLVSLRGTLVPATTINKTISKIPLLGKILVGDKTGEGVFGVSFKIKGPPKDLETSVNPIKTLTPRFITRTLEKIKRN